MELAFRHMELRTNGWTDGQTDVEVEIVIQTELFFTIFTLRGGSQITFVSLGGWVIQNLKKLQTLQYKIANF